MSEVPKEKLMQLSNTFNPGESVTYRISRTEQGEYKATMITVSKEGGEHVRDAAGPFKDVLECLGFVVTAINLTYATLSHREKMGNSMAPGASSPDDAALERLVKTMSKGDRTVH